MRHKSPTPKIEAGQTWESKYPGRSPITIDAIRKDIVFVTHTNGRKTSMTAASLTNNFHLQGTPAPTPKPKREKAPLPYTSPNVIEKGQLWKHRKDPSRPAAKVVDVDENFVYVEVGGVPRRYLHNSLSVMYSLKEKVSPAPAPATPPPTAEDRMVRVKAMFGEFIEQFRQLLVWDQTVARPLVLEGGAEEFKALIRQTVIEAIDEATGTKK
jgi:hypothetical protein